MFTPRKTFPIRPLDSSIVEFHDQVSEHGHGDKPINREIEILKLTVGVRQIKTRNVGIDKTCTDK